VQFLGDEGKPVVLLGTGVVFTVKGEECTGGSKSRGFGIGERGDNNDKRAPETDGLVS